MNDDKKTAYDKLRGWLCQIIGILQERASAILAILGIVMVSVFLMVMAFDWISCFFQKGFGTANKKETLEFLGLGIGGIIASYGLVSLNKRAAAQAKSAAAQVESAAAQVETNKLTEKGHVQDRFKAAVEHLSNKEPSARIASFYEFFYLAKDENKYIESILDILCAHLRHISSSINPEGKPSEEIKTLIGILFSREAVDIFGELDYDLQRVNLNEIDFQKMQKPKGKVDFSFAKLVKANFIKKDLSGFNFQKVNLKEAHLWDTNFDKANLSEATLEKAYLWNASLKKAHLFQANLEGAHLFQANLEKANLFQANLKEAELWGANLSGVFAHATDFRKAGLQGANLREANLREAKLQEASLRKVDLRETKNLETAVLSEAEYDNETKFPEGFNPAAHGMVKDDDEIE